MCAHSKRQGDGSVNCLNNLETLLANGLSAWMHDAFSALHKFMHPMESLVHNPCLLVETPLSLEAQMTSIAQSSFYSPRLVPQLKCFLECNIRSLNCPCLNNLQVRFLCCIIHVAVFADNAEGEEARKCIYSLKYNF